MFDDYQIPAISLIAALMLAFAYLHLRFRSVRTLLWITALGCAELQAILIWILGHCARFANNGGGSARIWLSIVGESALMVSSALFLGSLSPLSFRVAGRRILFIVPYTIPLLLYSILFFGVSQHPTGTLLYAFCFLALWAVAVAFAWSIQKGAIPIWLTTAVVGFAIIVTIPFYLQGNVFFPLLVIESGNMLMTALLVVYTFQRITPGVILTATGFLAWGLPPFFLFQPVSTPTLLTMSLVRTIMLGKVIVGMGLILLVLEDEVDKNQTAQQREHRVRLELEAYARQPLTARSLEEFDRESTRLCETIVEHSCFAGAAIVVRGGTGIYMLVGYAGMDGATAGALDAVVQRLPSSSFAGSDPGAPTNPPLNPPLIDGSTSLLLDLTPWLAPGDDLERLRVTQIGAVPLLGPDNTPDGALLLTAPREPLPRLRADDLLPLEILAGRMQAARTQAMMLGKLIDSERFAGVGQLATNVAQQLNNPLTVILGYATLLEESTAGADRRGAEAIGVEARRMKSILERLGRFSRLSTERFNSFSIADLINDIEQLHRTDFLRHAIEFRFSVMPSLPMVFGNPHQMRQALLHVVQFAIESVQRLGPNEAKAVRVEASSDEGRVQILIAHSGAGFAHPDRALDSMATGFSGSEPAGIGLSLAAAIVREHRGIISAINYQPTGAGILLDLPVS